MSERHVHRRYVAGGVVLGVSAALLLELLEMAFVARTAWPAFDGGGELARFAAAGCAVVAGAGALVGLLAGLLASAVGGTAFALGDVKRWRVRLYTAFAAAPVALVCAQIFRGPQAQKIPAHELLAVLLGVGALLVLSLALRVYEHALLAISQGEWGARAAWAATGALGLATYGAYVADQRILPRLYPFFHRGLGVVAIVLAGLSLGLVYTRLARARPGIRGLAEPRAALAIGVLALLAGAGGLAHFARARADRSLALDRTQPLARVLTFAARLTRASEPAAPLVTALAPALPDGPRLGDRDVFLITIDAMRADRLALRTAPTLSALAARGVTFARAYTQVPHTSFAVATLLTGKHVYTLSTLGLDAGAHQTLAEMLRRERYKTGAFYPPSVFFIDHDRLKALESSSYGFEYVKYEYLPGDRRTDQVIRFLDTERPDRVFVWIHYLEPHEPYEPHGGVSKSASEVERYDSEVGFVDHEVARLVEYLRAHRPRALLIVAADHGEEFGEHGGRYHGTTLYDEQVRVPLFFVTLDGTGLTPRVVGGPVGLVDVAPTVLSLLGIAPSAKMRGRDLAPFMGVTPVPETALGPEYAEIERKKMIARGQDKLICDLETDACQLFALGQDPEERKNLIDERRERAAELKAQLEAWMRSESRFERSPLESEATRRVLERGRLGDRSAAPALAELLGAREPATRREAARLLVRLPADPQVRPALERAARTDDAELIRWAAIGLARLGDAAARDRVRRSLAESDLTGPEERACAALAAGDAHELGRALETLGDDRELEVQLVRALAATRAPEALEPLTLRLASVRTRLDVVQALERLGDARILDTFDRWLGGEPYVPVRAEMARAMGQLARAAPAERRNRTRAALSDLATREVEPQVMRELLSSLGALGAADVAAPSRAHARGPGELWLSGRGDGEVTIAVGAATALTVAFTSGVARVPVRAAGPVALRAPAGAEVAWVYFRTAPSSQSR